MHGKIGIELEGDRNKMLENWDFVWKSEDDEIFLEK